MAPRVQGQYRASEDVGLQRAAGLLYKQDVVHKFGFNDAVGTSFVPVAYGGVYQTPQVAGATAVRIKAGNAADTALGAGAREVTVQGLDQTGALAEEAIATAGASASSVTTTTFIRIFRAWVSASGTYATIAAAGGSHTADIVIETSGGTVWATIPATDIARAQSEIGWYSVPLGYTAYVKSMEVLIESSKITDVVFFKRENILETAAPYSALRVVRDFAGLTTSPAPVQFNTPFKFPELTDIGFMAKVSASTTAVFVDFEIDFVRD